MREKSLSILAMVPPVSQKLPPQRQLTNNQECLPDPMKKIDYNQNHSNFDEVKAALTELGVNGMTITEVKGYGPVKRATRRRFVAANTWSTVYPKPGWTWWLMTRIYESALETIIKTARTGKHRGRQNICYRGVRDHPVTCTGEKGKQGPGKSNSRHQTNSTMQPNKEASKVLNEKIQSGKLYPQNAGPGTQRKYFCALLAERCLASASARQSCWPLVTVSLTNPAKSCV